MPAAFFQIFHFFENVKILKFGVAKYQIVTLVIWHNFTPHTHLATMYQGSLAYKRMSESGTHSLSGFSALFYLKFPSNSSFKEVFEVPDYIQEVFLILKKQQQTTI